MEEKVLYSSGQASEICNVSRRALRLYEAKGLIVPDQISKGGYRYFTMETLRRVQVIRYFLEEGFSLETAGRLLSTNELDDYEEIFRKQIEETKEQMEYYQNRLDSLKGWYGLLCEGRLSEIRETYERAIRWAKEHGLSLTGSSYERYVIDIYTSDNQDEYITEVLLPVECDNDEFNYLGV